MVVPPSSCSIPPPHFFQTVLSNLCLPVLRLCTQFFTPKRRPNREEVTTQYLDKFPFIAPTEFKVTGEATPGYLYCLTCPTYILKYLPRVRLLFTLRNPVVRAYSEYLNKRVDRTVMRYLHKRIDNKVIASHDRRHANALPLRHSVSRSRPSPP